MPINDVWIAATAMEHGSILLSSDTHFNTIDGLVLNTL
ncbi:MAG: PIN domain-containing protein [Spirochaetes bacterium]|nr:PIN domain-containing protein [Spirochaetota bacterium]